MKTTSPNVEIYIYFSFMLHTSSFADATTAGAAAAKALNEVAQKINMPIKSYEAEILEEEGGIYKTVIKARTEGRADFEDYKQTCAWRDMVHNVANSKLKRWKLKSRPLLIKQFSNDCSYILCRTKGSGISRYNIDLN